MKKLLILVCLLGISFTIQAQFPGKNVEMFKGTEITVKDKSESLRKYGYTGIYTTEAMEFNDVYSSVNYNTSYESVFGKVFKVLEVVPFEGKYRVKLQNDKTGILYYKYDPEYESAFIFDFVSGLKLPADFYCKQLERSYDKKNAETTLSTPTEDGIAFIKVTDENSSTIYLSASVAETALTANGKGFKLTLENGKQLVKPNEQIDVEANVESYRYSVFVTLTADDLKLLSESNIKESTIHIHKNPVGQGAKIREYLKCIMK